VCIKKTIRHSAVAKTLQNAHGRAAHLFFKSYKYQRSGNCRDGYGIKKNKNMQKSQRRGHHIVRMNLRAVVKLLFRVAGAMSPCCLCLNKICHSFRKPSIMHG